jgi:hypothetical protein
MSKPQRSLRLEKRSARSLTVLSGAPGEIFFDNDNGTLRVYTDNAGDSIILANRQWVTSNTFDGDYNNLTNQPTIPSIVGLATEAFVASAVAGVPTADLTGLATETYVDDAIAAADLTGLATETYVDDAIAAVDLTGLATETYVDDAIAAVDLTGLATETYVDDAIAAIPATDLTGLATETYVDDAIAAIPATDLTGLATETYVGTAISNLIDTAPAALDTLNELAAALGDDSNFASNVTSAIGLKADLASPTFTGTVGGITATMVGLGNVTNESKATMFTNPTFTGTTTLQQSTELLDTKTSATGTIVHDFSTTAIWYHSSLSTNFTANFTNVPTTNNRTVVCTLILVQGLNARLPTVVQIDGASQTIRWLGGSAPAGTPSGVDIVSFTLVRASNAWSAVLGSLSSYS